MKKRKSNPKLIPILMALVGVALVSSLFVSLILVQFEEPAGRGKVLQLSIDESCRANPCKGTNLRGEICTVPSSYIVGCGADDCFYGPCIREGCDAPDYYCPGSKRHPRCEDGISFDWNVACSLSHPHCGNGICEFAENVVNCAECPGGGGRDGACNFSCYQDCPAVFTSDSSGGSGSASTTSTPNSISNPGAPSALGGPDTNIGATPTPEPLASFFKSVFPTSSGTASRQCLVNYCVLGPGKLIPNCNVPVGPGPCGHPGCVEGACEVVLTVDTLDGGEGDETVDVTAGVVLIDAQVPVDDLDGRSALQKVLQNIIRSINEFLARFRR